ncbi:MAG: transcription-repair coupling factor [Firmicutes bacterium]|nr:transcription-repair coupling factor [Bacillota bacterium]
MINISGVSEARVAPCAAHMSKEKSQSIIIVPTYVRAQRLAGDLSFFVKDKDILVLPEEEQVFLRYEAKNHDRLIERMKVLKALRTGQPVIVVAPVSATIKKISPHKAFEEKVIKLKLGDIADLEKLKADLVAMGYEFSVTVESHGQFSVRGGIVDIFTPDNDNPYRIELFGDEVDSIRTFNKDTQRSIENLKYVEIYPAEQLTIESEAFERAGRAIAKEYEKQSKKLEVSSPEASGKLIELKNSICEYIENVSNLQLLENYIHYFYDDTEFIWNYMDDGRVMLDDPERIFEILEIRENELKEDFKVLLERGEAVPKDSALITGTANLKEVLEKRDTVIFTPFPKRVKGIDSFDEIHNINSRQMISFSGNLTLLENEIKSYLKRNYKISIVSNSDARLDNLREMLSRIDNYDRISFEKGTLSNGMDFPEEKHCWISENDIFKYSKKHKRRKAFKDKGQKIHSFSEMKTGDYVVHINHGIGKFIGIEQLKVQGEKKDYIKIKYAGNDMLYVPVEQMDLVQKYIGNDQAAPKINKLSGGEWKATKAKAKAAVAVFAKDLIDLYAKRKMEKGYSFSKDTVWQKDFEDSFPYEETDDQLRATEEIKADMEKPFPMDRLLCGDVGFGKTEVAARALFKCVSDGKQAAVLVPTTILANQHFYTLKERFEKFPFTVEVLSRFKTPTQQKTIISKLKSGEIDLIIGTHRLLSKEIEYKDLGLLVVDEEQRFGVEHKEMIKQLKKNIDVLTLSATPIPRTLNMSLTGIKDMSLIEEPPEERYPVQTYVMEQDDRVIRDIIERELSRGGQVYVVYNRVKGIYQLAERIENLVPEARIVVGHGQMNEHALEDAMMSFINGENNVLIATTIIESGIDIPNANTMIIVDSDRYGLSQLYQLRGRVGRANRQAYAYMMYQKDKVLTETAEKRLKAIREFTEFGSGFKVAMRDLEIRGAGNMLGNEQSGHLVNVGYELYCKMVDDAVRALEGEIVNDESREEATVELKASAYIPERYISDEATKLQMYKKIASIRTTDDEDEILDELLDRFGDVPAPCINLIKISHIRYLADLLAITELKQVGNKVVLNFSSENPLSGFALLNATERFGQKLFIHGGKQPFLRLSINEKKNLDETLELLQVLAENRKR